MSFKALEKITNSLIGSYPATQEWNDSPFNWIRGLPPASKGVVGRFTGSRLLQDYGFTVTAYRFELRVNAQSILSRMATKWEGDIVKFQNVRDIKFDHVLCLALYPKSAYAWLIPKSEIWLNGKVRADRLGVRSQHKGADAWIDVNPKSAHPWLKPYGGTIDDMIKVAKTAL